VLCCEVFKLLYKYLVVVSEVVVGKSVVLSEKLLCCGFYIVVE